MLKQIHKLIFWLLLIAWAAPANAWTHGTGFSGGKSQANSNNPSSGGDFPFINALKGSLQPWFYCTGGAPTDPTTLDSNGYPITITSGGVCNNVYIPSELTGVNNNWAWIWTGSGTVRQGNVPSTTVFGNSSTSPFILSFNTSGTQQIISGGAPAFELLSWGISATTGGNTLQNLALVYVGACTAPPLTGCGDYDDYIAGKVITKQYILRMRHQLRIGVVRFLPWGGDASAGMNENNVTTWATRKPVSYAYWYGSELRTTSYAGITTNSGDDYSLTCQAGSDCFGGGAPVDKQTIIIQFNSSATTNVWTLNLNGTGSVPLKDLGDNAFTSERPISGRYASATYDAGLNAWLKFGGDSARSNQGINNGVPPEIMIAAANAIGAHPWYPAPLLTLDPMTDYTKNLAILNKTTLNPGLIPRFEGYNEFWNTISAPGAGYGNAKAPVNWGAGSYQDEMGKMMSTLGQDVSSVYGGDTTKYQVVDGIQTATAGSGSNDVRFTSSLYVAQVAAPQSGYVKAPAYNYVTHMAMANYYNPTIEDQPEELLYSFLYAAGTSQQTQINNYLVSVDAGFTGALTGWTAGVTYLGTKNPIWGTNIKANYYEGGYSIASGNGPGAASVTAAVNNGDGTTTFTLGTTGSHQFAAVAGMTVHLTAATGGTWSTILNNTFLVNSYDGAGHALMQLDSSALGTLASATMAYDGFVANITNITKANPCVVTVSSNPFPGIQTAPTAAAYQMNIVFNNIGGMVSMNTKSLVATSMAGNVFSVNQDCSGFAAYTSGGTATLGVVSAANGLRMALKYDSTWPTRMVNQYTSIYGIGSEFPSQFLLGFGFPWGYCDLGIYAACNPLLNGASAFNGGTFP